MRRWAWALVALLAGAGSARTGAAWADPHVIQMPPPPGQRAPAGGATAGILGIFTRSDDAVARRKRGGTFEVDAAVNGESLPMIVDTGASAVSLRPEDAERAGIRLDDLRYSIVVHTANGSTAVAPVVLRTLQIGRIVEHDVPAVVAKPGALTANLLGQTFLGRLRDYQVESDRVIFHAR